MTYIKKEGDGRLCPIEIKKTSLPDKRLSEYSVWWKSRHWNWASVPFCVWQINSVPLIRTI